MPVEGGNALGIPAGDYVDATGNDTSSVTISTQVTAHSTNPLVGKNATGNNTMNVNSAVIALKLTDADGKPLNTSKLNYLVVKNYTIMTTHACVKFDWPIYFGF